MTHAEMLARYGAIGWLGRPSGDPLRRIAERALGSASGGAEGLIRGRGRPPGAASPTGIVGGSGG